VAGPVCGGARRADPGHHGGSSRQIQRISAPFPATAVCGRLFPADPAHGLETGSPGASETGSSVGSCFFFVFLID
jgi:hypothetical protein